MEEKKYRLPVPMLNYKEEHSLVALTRRYEKMTRPGTVAKLGKKATEIVPEPVKKLGENVKNAISEAELYEQCMKVVADGFSVLEKCAARLTISEAAIVKKVGKTMPENEISKIDEICLARSYDVAALVEKEKLSDLIWALIEGGATGALSFAGLPFNLVLSTFLYYRAVQSVAMHYGYNVKNDAAELVIAGEVFMSALSPATQGVDGVSGMIGKVMVMSELTAIKQTAAKSWAAMASRGGVTLVLTQMRALANKTAQKALNAAGQKGLENSLFKSVFEQIGRKLTKNTIGRSVPYAGIAIGALFDVAQMNTVLEYADVFYNKRFILEKRERINELTNPTEETIDIDDFEVVSEETVE